MDTVIKKDGKEIARIPNAVPVAFSPDGRVLLLRDAAADDGCRHFVFDVAGGEVPKPFGQRHRIGGRYPIEAEWSLDGRHIIFTNTSNEALPIYPSKPLPNEPAPEP
jgi:Tol biopolymer transport system component